MMNSTTNRFEKLWLKYKKYFISITVTIGSLFLVVLVFEGGAFLAVRVNRLLFKGSAYNSRVDLDVYAGSNWVQEYYDEFKKVKKMEYTPFNDQRSISNFHGKYINTDSESVRKTYFSCGEKSKNPTKIFLFGGSTMWGTGARDEGTIASLLAKILCDKGIPVVVTNFGETAFTNTNELIHLILQLRKGNIPDVAIFYDGINDVFSSYQNRVAGLSQNVALKRIAFEAKRNVNLHLLLPNLNIIVAGVLNRILPKQMFPVDEKLDRDTAHIYLENIRIIELLGKEYGFRSYFFWQPALFTKKILSNDEKNKITPYPDPSLKMSYDNVAEILRSSDRWSKIFDVRTLFNDRSDTIFVDQWHVAEIGNNLIAEKMAELFK